MSRKQPFEQQQTCTCGTVISTGGNDHAEVTLLCAITVLRLGMHVRARPQLRVDGHISLRCVQA
jgi:hypothetical protein